MEVGKVPEVLRERLGDQGTLALVELLDSTGRVWSEDVLTTAAERFGRRLAEECGASRLETATGFAALRQGMSQMRADLHDEIGLVRTDLHDEIGLVRTQLHDEIGLVRTELHEEVGLVRTELREHVAELRADFREELAAGRVDLIKWSFVFWIGQLVALSGVMAFMLRAAGGR